MTTATEYTTIDLNEAAYLIVRGHSLRALAGTPGGRRTFVFAPEAQADVAGFYGGASVPARAMGQAIRDMKALLAQG